MRSLAAWFFIAVFGLGFASTGPASAQDDTADESESPTPPADPDAEPASSDADAKPAADSGKELAEPTAPPTWWFGAYIQGAFVPAFMLDLFLGEAPTVGNVGFGVTATHRNKDGFSFVMGLGYQGYSFNGPFRISGDPEEDTEYLHSTLGLLHLRGQMMWSTEIVPEKLSFEYGFGIDLGVVLGQLTRSEAYRNPPGSGSWNKCSGPLNPAFISPSGMPYCELPQNITAGTDAYNEHGAQYNVVEKRVPPVALIPMLPALSLRYTPVRQVAVKLDFAYGLMQFAVGLSAAYGVDL
jgi:hypothetical protein